MKEITGEDHAIENNAEAYIIDWLIGFISFFKIKNIQLLKYVQITQ